MFLIGGVGEKMKKKKKNDIDDHDDDNDDKNIIIKKNMKKTKVYLSIQISELFLGHWCNPINNL
jgi:hypothetical protein